MTCSAQRNRIDAAEELIMRNGFDGLAEAFRTRRNEPVRIERERHPAAGAWERSCARRGHAKGCKAKTVKSRFGEVAFDVPRDGGPI